MGGSKTKTVTDVQTVGLIDEADFGSLRKNLLLEAGKKINSGFGMVRNTIGMQMVDMKSLYNDSYLEALGYNPSEDILINKVDQATVENYTFTNIDSGATNIQDLKISLLSIEDMVILQLQQYSQFDTATMIFSDGGTSYKFLSAVENGANIDVASYIMENQNYINSYCQGLIDNGTYNTDDTVYTGYNVLSYPSSTTNINGVLSWVFTINATYTTTTTTTTTTIENDQEVETTTTTTTNGSSNYTLNIPVEIHYVTISNPYSADMISYMNSFNGTYSVEGCQGSYIEENLWCSMYNIDCVVNYISYNNYTVTCTSSDPITFPYSQQQKDNAIAKKKQEVVTAIDAFIKGSLRKIIWNYTNSSGKTKLAFVDLATHQEFVVQSSVSTMPSIPLKENRTLVNSTNQSILLKKLGFEGSDFEESLANNDMYDAYLVFGVSSNNTTKAGIAYIFEMFYALSDITITELFSKTKIVKKIETSFNNYNISQIIDTSSQIIEDSTHAVGEYWHFMESETVTYTTFEDDIDVEHTYTIQKPVYCKQVTQEKYIRITRDNLESTLIVGGATKKWSVVSKTSYFNSSVTVNLEDGQVRYPLIREIFLKLPHNLYVDLLESSMAITLNTIQQYKTKWYQSGFFRFVMLVVLLVIAVNTGWVDMSLLEIVITAGSYVSAAAGLLGIDMGVLGYIFAVASLAYGIYNIATNGINTAMQGVNAANTLLQIPAVITSLTHTNGPLDGLQQRIAQQQQELESEKEEEEELREGAIPGGILMLGSSIPVNAYYDMALGNYDQYGMMYEDPYNFNHYFRTSIS